MPTVKEGKHILKPNADPRAARFRSVIRLYLEVLEAGSLDENLIPEIEGVFKEVGALAGLDFETIRTGLELGEGEKKKKHAGGRPRNIRKSDTVLLADLPERFGWKDVAEVWGVSRPAAFKRLAQLVEKNLVYPAGPGFYRVSGSLETDKSLETPQKKSLETKKPSLETPQKKSLETPARGQTPKTGKSTGKEPKSLETEPSLETPQKKSLETKKPSLETPQKKSLETKKMRGPITILRRDLAATYPRATGDPATMARADFIPNTGYQAILRSTYPSAWRRFSRCSVPKIVKPSAFGG